MTEMVRLHGSVKEIWEGINESYVHPVTFQITIMKKLILACQHFLQSSFNHNVL